MVHYLRERAVFCFCKRRVEVTHNFLCEDVILATGVFVAFLMTDIYQIILNIELSSSIVIQAKPIDHKLQILCKIKLPKCYQSLGIFFSFSLFS